MRDGAVLFAVGQRLLAYALMDVIQTFKEVSGRPVPYVIDQRRVGDVAICYADPTLAKNLLGWTSKRSLTQMCADHWHFQMKNPNGYRGA